ncbi:resistance to inhibitors of cholinesterase protein 3-like [Patiria miniata]|uniref:Resistance to inhibitors of cholinesterase protein 3 N-terminal domain-containing protein n=1 Tax=Patiria miniata TaxID=46514 RepID=A0A913ZPV0_PATMI|nr:resistance to inhibitors of cholinesterase protein 3-like [Patiria miniata]
MAFYHTMCFVFTVLIICNLVLYPSIFSSVFRKWFGSSEPVEGEKEKTPEMPPQMRNGPRTQGATRRMEMERAAQRNMKHADPASYFAQQKQEASSKGRGLLGSVLPVYAVGIVIYFAYIMYRIFLKDKSKSNGNGSGASLWDSNQDGASLQRVQQEQLQKQLSEQLRAENYTGITAKKAGKASKAKKQPVRKDLPVDTSGGTPDEVAALKKRLEDTERSMQRMMEMMNSMGIAMSQVTEQLTGSVPTDLADSLNRPIQHAEEEASDEGEGDLDSNLDSEDDDGDVSGQEEPRLVKKTRQDDDEDCTTDEEGGDVEVIGEASMEHSDTVRRRLVPAVGGES